MMTRKDYVETAKILNKFSDRLDSHEFDDLVFEFSEMFLADNERFSSEKFEEACYNDNKQNFNYTCSAIVRRFSFLFIAPSNS